MKEVDNDKLLRNFFAENRQEIADNGFSRRVMHHLPDRSYRLARLWSAFVMAIAIPEFCVSPGFFYSLDKEILISRSIC